MAARPTWKGHLRISLVSIPVQVFPATESSASISFNQLHAACQTRIQQKRWVREGLLPTSIRRPGSRGYGLLLRERDNQRSQLVHWQVDSWSFFGGLALDVPHLARHPV
jgi:hypothetical protein